jgi:3-hydroxyisobutyrate dehydrogenase-like beta-hydroxyacid dehydrogenase
MGARMAGRLLDAGHALVVHEPRAAALAPVVALGAQATDSPRAVADRAETVFVSLPTPGVVRDVALGPKGIALGTAVRTYVDLSTTGPDVAEAVAADLAQAGIAAVDAPVSGGPAGATAGTLTFMVSGEDEAVARVRPLLDLLAHRIFVVGDRAGQGQLTKVINNLGSACCIAITGEATVLGAKAGLDPGTLLDVIGVSSGANNAATDKFPKQVLTRRFDHGFRLELMAKDVGLCVDAARSREVPMLLGSTVDELWRLAVQQEEDGADCTAIVQMFEDWGGATVTSDRSAATEGSPR